MIPRIVPLLVPILQSGDTVCLKSPRNGGPMVVIDHRLSDDRVMCEWNEGLDSAGFDIASLRFIETT